MSEPIIINGRKVADTILQELTEQISYHKTKGARAPGLAVIIVGDNPASIAYVNMKKRACEQIGITSHEFKLGPENTESDLIEIIENLNHSQNIDGILLQLPLPAGFDEQKILQKINPEKDVDGFHPINIGKLLLGLPTLVSCTPYGVCKLLEAYDISTQGKHVVIVGRSNIVGKPLAALLLQKNIIYGNATVTVCHSNTPNIRDITRTADILIAAIGQPHAITADMVQNGCTVIDVGTSKITKPDGSAGITGDVDFIPVSKKAKAISPVPGGVGPMTIAMLMSNTVQVYKNTMQKHTI
jgi:methylenetetrahydrofolate dehydrogenase (NADP+) / methenyltetrahydrofolate cyclohydrolase